MQVLKRIVAGTAGQQMLRPRSLLKVSLSIDKIVAQLLVTLIVAVQHSKLSKVVTNPESPPKSLPPQRIRVTLMRWGGRDFGGV